MIMIVLNIPLFFVGLYGIFNLDAIAEKWNKITRGFSWTPHLVPGIKWTKFVLFLMSCTAILIGLLSILAVIIYLITGEMTTVIQL